MRRLQTVVYSHQAGERSIGIVRAAVVMVEVNACHICGDCVINQGIVQVLVSDKGRVSTIELQLSFPFLLCNQGRKVHCCWLSPEVNRRVVRGMVIIT